MITDKQRVAALLEHLQDSCSLHEIIFYLQTLVRWDLNGTYRDIQHCSQLSEAEKFDLTASEEWDRKWAAEAERRMADIESGIDEGIPAEIVLAEARARVPK